MTCADLQGCCDEIVDPDTQEACNKTAAQGNDMLCASTLQGFVLAGFCSG